MEVDEGDWTRLTPRRDP